MANDILERSATSPLAPSKSSISSLHVLKAILAFSVVSWHCPLGAVPWLQIPGIYVDLFFAITGYFLYSSDFGKFSSRVRKSIKKIIPIIILLQVIYYLIAPFPLESIFKIYWVYFRWIVLGFVHFTTGPLWYMNALLYGLLFLWGYVKIFKGRHVSILMILPVLWTAWTLIKYFVFHESMVSIFQFNFLTRAVPFLAMGYWIRSKEESLLKHNWLTLYLLLVLASGLEYALSGAATGGGAPFSFLASMPLPFALFMLTITHKEYGSGTLIESIGARYSGTIYYVHQAIILLWKGVNPTCPSLRSLYEQGGALFVFFLSLLIAILVEQVMKLFKKSSLPGKN